MNGLTLYQQFLSSHRQQLLAAGVPQHFWETIYKKIHNEIFDACEKFQLLLIDYEDEDKESVIQLNPNETAARPVMRLEIISNETIKATDPSAVYLIDHAWKFTINTARQNVTEYDALQHRLCSITGVNIEDEDRVDKILDNIWKYCRTYSVISNNSTDDENTSIWYVLDEVGSAVMHSDEPNFRIIAFLDQNTQTTFSLLYPLQDCENGDIVTCNFVEYIQNNAPERKALLLPWEWTDLREINFIPQEPNEEYFTTGHILESYPTAEEQIEPIINRNAPLKVYAEYSVVRDNLTSSYFQLVENEDEADILWITHHFKNFAELATETPNKFINQFPFEYVVTIKDLLSIVCRRAVVGRQQYDSETLETYPKWLPTTFNLQTEILEFASYYQHREAKGLDNHWIVKPWNLARGLDTHITKSIQKIVRLPLTGPKIAQKYIENPVLFNRVMDLNIKVKFDIRYVILLKSVQPLEAYIHRKFFLRFANKEFHLNNFDDYEKHFTVMNYQSDVNLCHLKCDEFLQLWQEQYPSHSWSDIEDNICSIFYNVFECATELPPPRGISPCKQSRALYAADVMLEWNNEMNMQPKLLEINWTPDCKRACDYYPEFFNEIFELLFLNECKEESFRLLTK